MDALGTFKALDRALEERGLERELIICGGSALIILGIISRQTRDVDVISPKMDAELIAIADALAPSISLRKGWLNNGPALLAGELPAGWEARAVTTFQGTHLHIKSIGRIDLIFTKLYATVDRVDDLDDLVRLKPTLEELDRAMEWVLQRDASEIWPRIAKEALAVIKGKLGYE